MNNSFFRYREKMQARLNELILSLHSSSITDMIEFKYRLGKIEALKESVKDFDLALKGHEDIEEE